jgi:ribonucleoside-diphosphate reductase alpha chain
MKIGKNAITVLERRYLIKDENNQPIETVEGLFWRVAEAIAAVDKIYQADADIDKIRQEFFDMMTNLEFLPNSPTLMNAGRPLGQLSACFVLPVFDTMEDIFEAIKQAALIHKSGGGTGFSFSRLRQKGSTVNSTGGVASGPISFMKVFNTATEAVKQGGTRRGANMGILRVDHPDILEFIDCKANTSEITNFNISVGITEDFMNSAEKGEDYDLIDPSTGEKVGRLNAKEVYDKIIDAAWKNGEPGIIFLDRLNRDNVVPGVGEIESTNPCGEQPLLPYEACNLGSINLVEMLKKTEQGYTLDWDKLTQTVKKAVHFLDNVIDANKYPLPIIDQTTKRTRKIGLGVMGWADALLCLGIPYNSDEAVNLAEQVMGHITKAGRAKSEEIAQERGAFPLFEESTLKKGAPIRNATITTIAPTGTLSIIAGVSSGVEPVFAYAYIRNIMDGTQMVEVNPILEEVLKERGIYSKELMEKIARQGGLHDILEIPEDIRRTFVCAHEVSPIWHTKMQAAFQRYTDNAVSKTVNFSNEATREDVKEVYDLAFELGCKGVTIYRDGSREAQVLNIGGTQPAEGENNTNVSTTPSAAIVPRPRPEITTGVTEKVAIGCGNLYITVNYDDMGVCEVFTNTGRAGGCPSQSEATARLVSVALRSGMDARVLIDQLKGIRCPSTIRRPGMKVTSCPDAIARMIEKVLQYHSADDAVNDQKPKYKPISQDLSTASKIRFCPECGAGVEHEGGCVCCRQCGYSKCG